MTFAGRFLGVVFTCAGNAATVAVVTGTAAAAGLAELDPKLETPTSAGFGPCFEHALTTSNSPRIARPSIIASSCWRDQDESIVPETVLLGAWLLGLLPPDFEVVVVCHLATASNSSHPCEIVARTGKPQASFVLCIEARCRGPYEWRFLTITAAALGLRD